jgi:hypothetical protein
MEFILDTQVLKTGPPAEQQDVSFVIEKKEYQLRLITCQDLMLAAQQADVAQAERILIERCLFIANEDERAKSASDLSEETIKQLAEKLQYCDPHIELLINLTCPACAAGWQTAFDIASFLWDEIVAHSKKLLTEIHQLAQAYGWNETEILALHPVHKQFYLAQIN